MPYLWGYRGCKPHDKILVCTYSFNKAKFENTATRIMSIVIGARFKNRQHHVIFYPKKILTLLPFSALKIAEANLRIMLQSPC